MKHLNSLLLTIKSELEKGNVVSIFGFSLISQPEMYGDVTYIDYNALGYSKENILHSIKELSDMGEISLIDSGNMGYWIELPEDN